MDASSSKKSASSHGKSGKDKKGKDGNHSKKTAHKKKKKTVIVENTHDEIEDLFPPIHVKYALDEHDLEVNAENLKTFLHNTHENADIMLVDYDAPTTTVCHQAC